ncbi:MAG: DUF4331 family protein [Rhizobacter sp.]|nr:DUF4331 family protein [Ferruginibacter sp.]
MKRKIYAAIMLCAMLANTFPVWASSHREAPMIADDPEADNTDVYAFKSPTDPNKIILIANYIPLQLPQGGPNFAHFSEDVRYEIHIDNDVNSNGDDIIYRFSFERKNEDPTTFFNIRLGKENLKTTYTLERSTNGGRSFSTILNKGKVPPPNVGARSISSPVGLNSPDYETLMRNAIGTARTGEKVFCGPVDDPFFVDLGGIFDLGDAPRQGPTQAQDGLKCLNVSTIAIEVDVATLQKDNKGLNRATSILDPNYVIGVWASASRQKIRVLNEVSRSGYLRGENNSSNNLFGFDNDDKGVIHLGPWVQVSRLGMPLTNEAVVPIGDKDLWNRLTPYQDLARIKKFGNYFYNPELALYMDDAQFGGAVPAFSPLRIQKNSLGAYGFGNGQNGLFALKGNPALNGTALSEANFGGLLLPGPNKPRSVDLWPIFHTGVPNLAPYQLATGKAGGNPLAKGKPFINNFLPNGGDMLRLNMAVPATSRTSSDFSSEGLVQAAVLGLLDPRFNSNTNIQFIPNMDGFPNGRRLEDDVTRIELQAVSGIVLAAIGLWYDDYVPGTSPSPVTPKLLSVLGYSTGINANDAPFKTTFPFEASPWAATHNCDCGSNPAGKGQPSYGQPALGAIKSLAIAAPDMVMNTSPNPFVEKTTVQYQLHTAAQVTIAVFDINGKEVKMLANKKLNAGTYTEDFNAKELSSGTYFIKISKDGKAIQTMRVVKGQ